MLDMIVMWQIIIEQLQEGHNNFSKSVWKNCKDSEFKRLELSDGL